MSKRSTGKRRREVLSVGRGGMSGRGEAQHETCGAEEAGGGGCERE